MNCPNCNGSYQSTKSKNPNYSVKKRGTFFRKSDSRTIQRFLCKRCEITFSTTLNDPARMQKKRRENAPLFSLLSSGISQRRAALILKINRKTVARKLQYLSGLAREELEHFLRKNNGRFEAVQFDELQTIEHTKCKPLSVALAVTKHSRKILGVAVSKMPATGHLAKISRKKYGFRPDERRKGLNQLFMKINPALRKTVSLESDEHPYYLPVVNRHCPEGNYTQYKGEKGAISGQGELKKVGRDPLFYINHTLAMLRANINRLIRKTWYSTKIPARLLDHLYIYIAFHNRLLTA